MRGKSILLPDKSYVPTLSADLEHRCGITTGLNTINIDEIIQNFLSFRLVCKVKDSLFFFIFFVYMRLESKRLIAKK